MSRARWDAAAAENRLVAAEIDALPAELEHCSDELLRRINAATYELRHAFDAAEEAGASPTEAEWAAAYGWHRDALIAWGARARWSGIRAERVRVDAVAAAARAARWFR